MTLRFILGRAGSGKTYYCLSEMARLLSQQQDGTVLFILPEQATFIHERMLACDFTPHGYAGGEVTSFNRLIWQAARRAEEKPKPALSEAGRALLMGRLLSERRAELKLLGATSWGHGFAAALADLAAELQAYNIEPAHLGTAAAARQAERPADPLAAKLADIALLYGDYVAALEAYDNIHSGLAFLAREIAENGFLAGATVFVDGYSSFTPREQAVLTALLRQAARLEIALCLDPTALERTLNEQDIFYPCWHNYGLLMEAAQKLQVKVEAPLLLNGKKGRFAHNAELALVERHLYPWSGGPLQPEKPASLRVVAADSPREELLAAGQAIQRLVREEGLRYREISVIARDLSPYQELLPGVFGELGIPYFADSKKPLLYHPVVELTRAALEIWANESHYRQIFRYFKSGLTPLSATETDALENYCLAHGVRHWQWREDADWHYWRGPEPPEEARARLAEINELRRRGSAALACFLHAAPPPAKPVEAGALLQALRALLADLQVAQTLACWQDAELAAGQAEAASQHRQALDKLVGFLDEAEALLTGCCFSAQQLLSLLDAGCAALTLSLIPPGLDQVLVASLERSRNPELSAAIVIGVNADMLPGRAQPPALLADHERAELERAGIELAPDTLARQMAEHYLAYVALTRSNNKLLLTYALNGADGKTLLPSPLIKRLQRLFPALKTERYGEARGPAELSGGAAGLSALARQLTTARQGGDLPGFWRDVYNWYAADENWRAPLQRLNQGLYFAPRQQRLAEATRRRLYGQNIKSSVSRLEKFNACPFAYFAAYGLKLKTRPVYELTPLERGDIFHQALAELSRRLDAGNPSWQELTEAQAGELVGEVLARLIPGLLSGILSSTARYRYLAARLQDTLTATLLLLAEHMRRGKFTPVAWELPFGGNTEGGLPALTLELPGGRRLEISGQIDRVDVAQGENKSYVRVIDYKSGKMELAPADIESGLRLQLLVYLEAVLENPAYFKARQLNPAGLYYMTVRDEYSLGPMPPAEEENQFAGLRLAGLSLKDEEAVRLADPQINGHSQLIPVALGAKGFYANSPGLTAEELHSLREELRLTLVDTASRMAEGHTEVAPRRAASQDACYFCDYRALCGFDREIVVNSE